MYPTKDKQTFRWVRIMPLGGFWVMSGKPGCHKPVPIRFGVDTCTFCKRVINDRKLACEWITSDRKVLRFDSVDCMIAHMKSYNESDDISSVWVSDYTQIDHWIPAERAVYLYKTTLKTTMGSLISAYAAEEVARSMQKLIGGTVLNWQDLIKSVSDR